MIDIMGMPLVSVIMPIYNGAAYMEESIRSVLEQNYKNIELLICNDASTDNTAEIIDRLMKQDTRISVVKNEVNSGISISRNKLLDRVKGKYFITQDCDDNMLPGKVEMQVKYMEAHPECGMCGTWARKVDEKTQTFGKIVHPINDTDIRINLLFQNSMVQPSVMVRSEFIDRYRYDGNLLVCEDYDYWERLSGISELHNIPQFLVQYRIHGTNISKSKEQLLIEKTRAIKLRQLLRVDKDAERYIEVHDAIGSLRFPDNIAWAEWRKECLAWLKRLIEQNRVAKIYPENAFKAFVWYRWIRYCVKRRELLSALFPNFFTLNPVVLYRLFRLMFMFVKR